MNTELQLTERQLRKQISTDVCNLLANLARDAYGRCNERTMRKDFDFYQAQAQAYETARMLLRALIEKELH